MTFLFGNCCLKLNSLLCGSNESTLNKKKMTKKKFKLRHNDIVSDMSSNKKMINQGEPTPINVYQQHAVHVLSPVYNTSKQQHNSEKRSLQWTKEPSIWNSIQSHDSSCSSSIDHRLWRSSSHSQNHGITIKDVILRRVDPHERLGLTLCYGVTSRSTTNIYIQQVDGESVAGRCGQLQNGDQIVKINNHRVTSREQAISLVQGVCLIILQIFRFEFVEMPLAMTTLQSPMALTEDDSGVVLACTTDLETTTNEWNQKKSPVQWNGPMKSSTSLSKMDVCSHCRRLHSYSNEMRYRRCLSLTDLRPCPLLEHQLDSCSSSRLIRSQSLLRTMTDNTGAAILKPLPFNNRSKPNDENLSQSDSGLVHHRDPSSGSCSSFQVRSRHHQWTLKYLRRRCREERLKRQYQSILTTDDEAMSELKQGRYWTRQQRKEHLARAREHRQRARFFQQHANLASSHSATEDFNLLNRVFLNENQQELQAKPDLAAQFSRQTSIEREKLKQAIKQHYYNRIRTHSTTTISLSTNNDYPPMVIL